MFSVTTLWLQFTIAVLATWRLAHLIAHEDGPGDIVPRLRRRVKHAGLAKMLDCVYYLSVWIAAPVALWLTTDPLDWAMTALAISGAASLIERSGHQPVVFHELPKDHQPDDTSEGDHHELLRTDEDAGARKH